MNDDAKAALDQLRDAVKLDRQRCGDDMAESLWKNELLILAHIDGEPARIAAAVADASSAALRAMSRAVKAEVRVAELERTLKERDEQSLFEGQREHEWNASFNATVIERAEKAEAERDMLQTALRDNSAAHSETGKALLRAEAQVEAARAACAVVRCGSDCDDMNCASGRCQTVRRVLAAMDGAKP